MTERRGLLTQRELGRVEWHAKNAPLFCWGPKVKALLRDLLAHIDMLQALAEIGQAAIDYDEQAESCVFCERLTDAAHDDECPVGEYLKEKQ